MKRVIIDKEFHMYHRVISVDVAYFMTNDHRETGEMVERLIHIYESGNNDENLLTEIEDRLEKHIYIEEQILFLLLPVTKRKDVEYLEREHGKFLGIVKELRSNQNRFDYLIESGQSLINGLIEHDGFEESFIYDYFDAMDAEKIRFTELPKDWKCVFC